jgi:hypothetical protein
MTFEQAVLPAAVASASTISVMIYSNLLAGSTRTGSSNHHPANERCEQQLYR